MNIRQIQKKDNAALAALIREVFEEYGVPKEGTVYTDPTTDRLYETFQQKGSYLLLAEENGKILGACGFYPTKGLPSSCAELVKFYLSKDARGKRLGSELYRRCEEQALKMGYTHLYLECFSKFKEALKMYEKLGYRYLSERMGESGHFGCGIWMMKEIGSKN